MWSELIPLLLCCMIETIASYRVNSISGPNNFSSKSTISVSCSAAKESGPCNGQEEAFYFDTKLRKCHPFLYSGCGGNGNRFRTLNECKESCYTSSMCEKPSCPSGCVISKRKGDSCPRCSCSKGVARKICLQEERKGYGRALQHKWAYSKDDKKCVPFIYGGLDGNENNFRTREECMHICKGL